MQLMIKWALGHSVLMHQSRINTCNSCARPFPYLDVDFVYMKMTILPFFIAVLFAAGCSTPVKSNSFTTPAQGSAPSKACSTGLEGQWHGNEVTPGQQGSASLTFSDQSMEFHGADANDWCKGTFILRENTDPKQLVGTITDCPSAEMVGKTVYAIYKIQNGTLTISGNAPGDPNIPAAFDAPGTRQFIFEQLGEFSPFQKHKRQHPRTEASS